MRVGGLCKDYIGIHWASLRFRAIPGIHHMANSWYRSRPFCYMDCVASRISGLGRSEFRSLGLGAGRLRISAFGNQTLGDWGFCSGQGFTE